MSGLSGRRVLVVGASSGIGRATAIALAGAGARVWAVARRAALLEALARDAPAVRVASVDVRDADAVAAAVSDAVTDLGGLDAAVYAAGLLAMGPAAELAPEAWRSSFEVNCLGAVFVLRAAGPALAASRGRAILVSSRSAGDSPPRPGIGPYIVSKAALDKLAEVWQEEHPAISVTRVVVGDTAGTDMARDFHPERGGEYVREWLERRVMHRRAMRPDDVARHLLALLDAREAVPTSSIRPRPPEGVPER